MEEIVSGSARILENRWRFVEASTARGEIHGEGFSPANTAFSWGRNDTAEGDGSDLLVPRARDPTHQSTRMALAEGWGRPGSGREGAALAWVKWVEKENSAQEAFWGFLFPFFVSIFLFSKSDI